MNNNDITLINKDSNNKGGNKFTQLLVILVVILLIVVVAIDILVNNVDFKDIFSQTINYTTEKEVTVTDEGIADAVEKLYDATVVVKVTNKNKKVIAVARLKRYGEHVNDHQKQIVENFADKGYIIPLDNVDDLDKALDEVEKFEPKKYKGNNKKFLKK